MQYSLLVRPNDLLIIKILNLHTLSTSGLLENNTR